MTTSCLCSALVAAFQVAPSVTVEPAKIGPYDAERGRLRVPENRADPKSRTLELAFVRLKSPNKSPGAPVIYLAGGPGNPATPLASSGDWRAVVEQFDLVFLDQRGTGSSTPSVRFAPPGAHVERFFGNEETMLEEYEAAARALAEHARREAWDLAGYTTVEIARDVDDLRRALGLERIGLLGHSYGTHLGLEVVRQLGDRVDGFVSIGTAGTGDMYKLPLDCDAALERLADVVAADATIGADVPDLVDLFERVLGRLDEAPIVVRVADLATGARVEVPVGRFGLQLVVLRDLGDVSDIPVIPRLLADLERGDARVLEWFVQKRFDQMQTLSAMALVARAASGATRARWELIESQAGQSRFGRARLLVPPRIGAILGAPDLGDAFRAPVQSDVRALFVSGTLDANTPPEQAEAVRKGFPNSAHVIVENGGHEDLLDHAAVKRLVLRFLRGETVTDARVAAPPVRFVPIRGHDPRATHPAVEYARSRS